MKITKNYCDWCGKEVETKEYLLPMYTSTTPHYATNSKGHKICVFYKDNIEPSKLDICDNCAKTLFEKMFKEK